MIERANEQNVNGETILMTLEIWAGQQAEDIAYYKANGFQPDAEEVIRRLQNFLMMLNQHNLGRPHATEWEV